MPPVKPMLAKPHRRDPRRAALRAEVGRLPLDHLPRRRRGGDRQPQRAADDPLLPRGRRGGAGQLPRACGDRRRDRRRSTGSATRLDFEALQQRIHPAASRVKLLAVQTPASFVAFDLLALGDDDLTEQPFGERRAALEEALRQGSAPGAPHARHRRPRHRAGVVRRSSRAPGWTGSSPRTPSCTYQPDKRVMTKIKHERTADCVVAGYRVHKSGPDAIGSLLLGLLRRRRQARLRRRDRRVPDGRRAERCSPSCSRWSRRSTSTRGTGQRRSRASARRARTRPAAGTPARTCRSSRCAPSGSWRSATTTWRAIRFRHTAQFVRWRPDRDPASCTYEQLEQPVSFDLAEVLTSR